jgi:hypothetical protein
MVGLWKTVTGDELFACRIVKGPRDGRERSKKAWVGGDL